MKQLLSGEQMHAVDKYNIEKMGMPSSVLMERAALACANIIKDRFDRSNKIGVICGTGNNGGDGVAIARILHLSGYDVLCYILGDVSKYTDELNHQISIANNYKISFVSSLSDLSECSIYVDAIFGIGLSREVTGIYKEAIEFINSKKAKVLSVDIPSGYSSDTGVVLGCGIISDVTVTFAYIKKGLLLNDCFLNRGELLLADVGIYINDNDIPYDNNTRMSYLIENIDLDTLIPPTSRKNNKGSNGKVLVIAGSESIYGACYLSAKAALSSGSGLVKIYTHVQNINSIQTGLPEAMYKGYDSFCEQDLNELINWADTIVIGPGLSTNDLQAKILEYVLTNSTCPIVIDADGINIVSKNLDLLKKTKAEIVLTPHLMEMSRLTSKSIDEIKNNMELTATDFCNEYDVNIILKNYTSFISTHLCNFINITGNEGMATAGSGDVLSGILASLLAQGVSMNIAPGLASFIHGTAGEKASNKKGKRQMLASDIIDHLSFQ